MSPQSLTEDASLRPYEAIAEHAELELEFAGRGEVDRVAEMAAQWEQLVAGLPDTPPAAAAPMIERARLMHERTRIDLIRLRDALLADLAATRQASRAASGYAGTLPGGLTHIDRSA